MTKSDETVLYMISIWDETRGKSWREKPNHVEQKFLDAEDEARKRTHEYYRNQLKQK